jgi:enterochelin esterase-like enzyme
MTIFTTQTASAKIVDFIINVPFLTPENSQIFISGNIPELCNWKPDCLKMNSIGNGSYKFQIQISDEIKNFNYKITRGAWESEAADSYSKAYNEIAIDLEKVNLPIVQNIIHWKDLAPLVKSTNVQTTTIYSHELGTNKEISIYVPPTYYSSTKSYPVIYMHDGQNVFDPTTSTFQVKWGIDEIMNKLIHDNKINEAIIVAIHTNNKDRWDEYDYYLKGKNYSDFVVNSVIPYVEKNFRTNQNRDSRYLMGSSMGALISLMMLIDRPDIFSKGAGVSFPAFIHNRAIFRFLDEKTAILNFNFYMDHGDYGVDANYGKYAKELYSALVSRGLTPEYLVFPYADHSEADWSRRAYIPLEYLLN